MRYLGQAIAYVVFFGLVGYFSTSPAYTHLPADQAVIKLSFAHAGKVAGDCRKRTDEELAKLPPNMRQPMDCPRERSPILIELELDGRLIHREELRPTGLARDGTAYIYQSFRVPAGEYRLEMRMRDDVRTEGFDYISGADVKLEGGRLLVIDFQHERGGFALVQ
jgi:hypothetical protein